MDFKHLLFTGVIVMFIQNVQPFKLPSLSDIFYGIPNILSNVANVTGNEDAHLNITQLAHKYKFNIEEHKVTTEDGYILSLQRLGNTKGNGVPILLMHGIMESADCWVLQGPNNSLGYLLANEGFDVWMGNARGSQHSLSHVNLNPDDGTFWNFTWEEIGLHDLPATVDYILSETDSRNLHYVGHSQGTTSFYVMNALRPEYNEKIKMMFSLAPVAWMRNIQNPALKFLSKFIIYSSKLNLYTPSTQFFRKVSRFCRIFSYNCDNIVNLFAGSENSSVDKSMLPVIYGHYPSTSSALQFIHYGQLINSGRFCRFDFGESNTMIYGDVTPPDYNVSNVTVPTVLFYSDNDWLSSPSDVSTLSQHLPNVYREYFIENFNHIDYLYANSAKEKVYGNIIKHIWHFENNSTVQSEITIN